MDPGDIAWVLIATSLVMLMTPALGFFYAGLVRRKNLLSTLVQCLIIFAVVSIVWTIIGYSLVFGPSIHGVVGDLSYFMLNGVGAAPNTSYAPLIPALLYFAFQLKFAAITPALIIGAFVERIHFRSLLIFIVAWSIFIYSPVAHWVWNTGGWLRDFGALDFAGGLVVHLTAGFSALAAAIVIGRRKDIEKKEQFKPSNIPYVILGAALLWFGWFGFNAGSALGADSTAVYALVNTNLAASTASISWMLFEWYNKGKPSAVGMAVGAVCGLVAITPGSGYVTVSSSLLIGLIAGGASYYMSNWRASRTKIDDSLDVFSCHGVSGLWGSLAVGLFSTLLINPSGANGIMYGGSSLLVAQVVGVIVVALYSFVGTYVILKVIDAVSPLRVSPEDEEQGLDLAEHGEAAYDLMG